MQLVNKFKSLFEKKALVLMYHRVAQLNSDPWQLTVTEKNFDRQIETLSKTKNIISVQNLLAKINNREIEGNEACVTFDDGYRDNFFAARPILKKHNCPATFFIASGYVDSNRLFWWDDLENMILHSERLPQELEMKIADESFSFKLDNGGVLSKKDREMHKKWIWTETAPTSRCKLYLELWQRLKPLPDEKQVLRINEIKTWAGSSLPIDQNSLAMKAEQIEELISDPLFSIGLHTSTHPALSMHSAQVQQKEIDGCRNFLEGKFHRPVETIAYPYGSYNEDTRKISSKLKLAGAFTTEERAVTKNSDQFRLGRFQVKNWDAEEFTAYCRKWAKS